MAAGFFAILDDIGALMDDIALATKVATHKTVGILGDDLAVNAEKATGFLSERELPVLWSITKGSLLNKLIIVPIALLLNAFFPLVIKVSLVVGGCYFAYEGVEKIIDYVFHRSKSAQEVIINSKQNNNDVEKTKIKSAITTDFILSVEIVIIALGSVSEKSLAIQATTVSLVALIATIGVYGIVAIIVRMDDAGLQLIRNSNKNGFILMLGHLLVKSSPVLIKVLSVVGTFALILVAGGIFTHNIEYLHHLFSALPSLIKEFAIGLVAGLIMVAFLTGSKKVFKVFKK